jgi:hypothetical protein
MQKQIIKHIESEYYQNTYDYHNNMVKVISINEVSKIFNLTETEIKLFFNDYYDKYKIIYLS